MQIGRFNTVVDSAWGSSAKGAASTRLAHIHGVENLSSNNFPNAGHTAIVNGEKFVSKCLPTGAILKKFNYCDPLLWIGPNSGIELEQLDKELAQTGYKPGLNLFIHERAVRVEQHHKDAEAPGGKSSTLKISSTMSGSGSAYTDKAMRNPDLARLLETQEVPTMDPATFMYSIRDRMLLEGETFLHEVSQGFALSLDHGTHWPHCTFRNCTPQQAWADFGLIPELIGDVYLNVRSLPIRVGSNFDEDGAQIGYSGDVWPDQQELSWEQVGQQAGMPPEEIALLAERERTTVTKKIRRVFTQSWDLLKFSADFCYATKMILNFPQYIDFSCYKKRGEREAFRALPQKVREYITKMEETTNIPCVMIGTGPEHDDYIYID